MKFSIILICVCALLGSAFTTVANETPKTKNHLKITVSKNIITPDGSDLKELGSYEISNYTEAEKTAFIKFVNKKHGIVMFNCTGCSVQVTDPMAGTCVKRCCYQWAELVQCFEEYSGDCCGVPQTPCD